AARLAGAAEVPVARRSRQTDRAARRRHAARRPRSRDDRVALRDRVARLGAHQRAPAGSAPRRALHDVRREGEQGTPHPHRRAGDGLDSALPSRRAAATGQGRAQEPRSRGAVRQRPRRRADACRLLEDPEAARAQGRTPAIAQPARAAALVRHASARSRRRSARDSDDARPRRSLDDADLHARARGAAARGLRSLSPAAVIDLAVSRHREFPESALKISLKGARGMSRKGRHLFTSESVTEGHPDKIADQISDSILDAILAQDPVSRVACETLVTTGLAVIAGEITTSAYVDFQDVVRATINDVGYNRGKYGFDAETCAVLSSIHSPSPDIAL